MIRRFAIVLIGLLASAAALAASTVRLPAGYCAADDSIFWDAFEPVTPPPFDPSGGSGGAGPPFVTRTLSVPSFGSDTYYARIPGAYDPSHAVPLLIALHGYVGSHAAAVTAAAGVRSDWSALANSAGFIVIAPVGNDPDGSWVVPPTSPNDYTSIGVMLADVEARYNIDRARVYLWGFSAGGHVAWDMVFNAVNFATPLNASNLAGVAASAGALSQLACDFNAPGACQALVAAMPRKLPIDVHIGSSDPLLPYVQYDRNLLIANGWRLGSTYGYHEFNGGHIYTVAQLGEAWTHLCRYARGP